MKTRTRGSRLAALAGVGAACLAAVMSTATPASATILTGFHQIEDKSWHRCLDVLNASQASDAAVGARACANGTNQRWNRWTADGPTKLEVEHSHMCLNVVWQGDGYWSKVVQSDCNTAAVWTIIDRSDGWSEISTVPPPGPGRLQVMCLEKYGDSAIMWNCHQPDWQLWQSLG